MEQLMVSSINVSYLLGTDNYIYLVRPYHSFIFISITVHIGSVSTTVRPTTQSGEAITSSLSTTTITNATAPKNATLEEGNSTIIFLALVVE